MLIPTPHSETGERSRRSSSSYSFDDSGSQFSGVSHISEDIFHKTFEKPLIVNEGELFLKVQAREPHLHAEVLEIIKSNLSKKEIMDVMQNDSKLLSVINMALHIMNYGNLKKPVKAEMVERNLKNVTYRVCNPNSSVNKTPINQIPTTQSHYNVQLQNQTLRQNHPIYLQQPQQMMPQVYRVQQPQSMYKVTYPQYVYVQQPQYRPQFVYTAQPFRVAQQNIQPHQLYQRPQQQQPQQPPMIHHPQQQPMIHQQQPHYQQMRRY